MAQAQTPADAFRTLGSRIDRRVTAILWLFFFLILLRNSWLCEDAFISYRVADNFANGYGLRWNTIERVQVFTHPLWMLLVTAVYYVVRDAYFAGTALCLGFSGAAVWVLLTKGVKSTAHGVIAVLLLTFSKSFIDFSTSGLENPLSHLLLILYFLEYLKPERERSFARMVRWAGLLLVARMDLVWLWAPALGHAAWKGRAWERGARRAWLGLWPFVAWSTFAVLYYGFFFPNSAYAKLTAHLPVRSVVEQGIYYLLNSLAWDPLTLFATAALVWFSIARIKTDLPRAVVAIGVLLQVAYVVRIGGDYMSGRFVAAPFLVAVLLLPEFETLWQFCSAAGVALALGFCAPRPPIFMRDEYVGLGSSPSSVDDERGYRHGDTSLMRLSRDYQLGLFGGWIGDGVAARREHKKVVVYTNIGYFGFFAGPDVYIIDPYGIGDPLMARMPFDETMGRWLSGHFFRKVPVGYPSAALAIGSLADPALDAYLKKLQLVTRGPIFDPKRLLLVARFNLGLEPIPTVSETGAT